MSANLLTGFQSSRHWLITTVRCACLFYLVIWPHYHQASSTIVLLWSWALPECVSVNIRSFTMGNVFAFLWCLQVPLCYIWYPFPRETKRQAHLVACVMKCRQPVPLSGLSCGMGKCCKAICAGGTCLSSLWIHANHHGAIYHFTFTQLTCCPLVLTQWTNWEDASLRLDYLEQWFSYYGASTTHSTDMFRSCPIFLKSPRYFKLSFFFRWVIL